MGKRSSVDLRVRIMGEIERGRSRRAAALRFGVAPSTAIRLAQRKARTGSVAPARQGRPAGSGLLGSQAEALAGRVQADGDITMPDPATGSGGGAAARRARGQGAPGLAVALADPAWLHR